MAGEYTASATPAITRPGEEPSQSQRKNHQRIVDRCKRSEQHGPASEAVALIAHDRAAHELQHGVGDEQPSRTNRHFGTRSPRHLHQEPAVEPARQCRTRSFRSARSEHEKSALAGARGGGSSLGKPRRRSLPAEADLAASPEAVWRALGLFNHWWNGAYCWRWSTTASGCSGSRAGLDLQELGATSTLAYTVAPHASGAKLTRRYRVSGGPDPNLDQMAAPGGRRYDGTIRPAQPI